MDLSSVISSLEEDIQEFNLERDIKTSLKTQEELDKLTVDESLNDVERSIFLLSSGQEIQCISVVRTLPQLIKGWQNECVRRVVPKLKELLHTAGLDLQLAATEVFTSIAKDDLLPIAVYTQHFLRTIITNMNAKDPVVSQAWLDCLISVVVYLPREIVRREILGLAVAKGQLSQPTASRLSCCSILGAVAPKFDANVIAKRHSISQIVSSTKASPTNIKRKYKRRSKTNKNGNILDEFYWHRMIQERIKKDIIPTVKQLCQDVEHIVRTCMCAHLHSVANALGSEETRSSILEEVLELAVDEESQVREAALDCLLNMTNLLDEDTLKQNVVPLVCKYCEKSIQNEDHSMLSVVRNYGRFCHNLSANFSSEQHVWLLATFRHLCQLGRSPIDPEVDGCSEVISTSANLLFTSTPESGLLVQNTEKYVECRRQCAYNFPAITSFCTVSLFQNELLSAFSLLCTDPDVTVRKYIAAGLHEVANTLQANAHLVQSHLVHLLKDKGSPSVIDACLKRLPDTLSAVVKRGNLADNKVNGIAELIGALLAAISRLEQQWPSAWRPLETLVTHLRRLPDVFTSDQIYYKFVNVVFKLLTSNRYLPVREAAACAICVFIRHNKKVEQRTEMCHRLIQDLCYARNYRHRILFFTACRHMMVLFSRAYFKEYLFEHVLKLFDDGVPNVRLCLCKILPSMKSLLKLPRDRTLHGNLESSVRRLLSSEKDRDVCIAIRQTIFDLDRTEVAMESLTQLPLQADFEDQRKEDEERALIEREEKARDEDARSSKSHGSSHSSSSMGKGRANEKSLKKRKSSTFQNMSALKTVNGSKEKSKSSQYLNVPGSSPASRDNVLNSQTSQLSSMYNMTGSGSGTSRISSHFSHNSYSASQGPSTALGHKGYQSMAAVRSSAPSANSTSFPMNSHSNSQVSRSNRKTDRRHPLHNMSVHDNTSLATEVRNRKSSAGSASSSGSGDKAHKGSYVRRKNSSPVSPVLTNVSKNKKEKK